MGELKQFYLLIQNDIAKDNLKEALDTFIYHYGKIKDEKGVKNFTVSVISMLAQKLQTELTSPSNKHPSVKNINYIIQFADSCFKVLVSSEVQPWQNSLYVIVRYLLSSNHVSEGVRISNYLLQNSSPPCDILKHLVQLYAHDILKYCPIDDDLKKLNVILMWDAALNLVKHYSGKEIEYALYSLTTLIKSINGSVLHEGRSMDLVILDLTLESVLSSSIFRKKSDQDNMMNLYSMLIENIVAVMQNIMCRKKMHVHYSVKHIELMIDVCCLNKTEKEALSFLISLFKFIDHSIKNGLDSSFELRKMITFVKKYEPSMILPNTLLHHVFKAAISTITKLKNLWYEGLIINSPETTTQMFVLIQHLVYLCKYGSFSHICCKSNNCDLIEDSTSEMSLINIVFIMIRHIVTKHNKYLNSKDIQIWMELFFSLFERVSKSSCSNKISFIEFSLTSVYNLCIYMCSDEFTDICLNFLEKLCLKLDPNGVDSDLVARVAILLSRYLYIQNRYDEALRCIAYWCVRTRSELAALQWVHIKYKEEKNNRIINQTILNIFENDIELKNKWPEYTLKKSDCIEILWLELKAHSHRNKIKQNTSSVLELFKELISYKLSRELKCQVIIATSYIIIHSSSAKGLKKVIDVLEDYICNLERESSMEKKNMPLMIGNLYYANYLCAFKHLQNLVTKELDSYTEERLEPGMEQQNTSTYQPMAWILPLKLKPKLFNCLNLAVENWSTLEIEEIKDEYNVEFLFRSLQEVAFVFKLHCDPREVDVWKLLYKLASNKKCHKYIFISLSELIKIDKANIIELDNSVKHLPKMSVDYKLTLVTSFLNQSRFNDAQKLLEDINYKELNDNIISMAEYYYLKSRFCFESGEFNKNKTLSVFIEAYSIAHNLIKSLDSFYEYLAMHFVLLSICSYLNLIFINTLKPVEARCFLKVQMYIVLKSTLVKRALNVFTMNSWNELLCCNFENTNMQLEHVMTLLDFKEDKFDLKMQTLNTNHTSDNLSSPVSDYRCMQSPRQNKMASPSLKKLSNKCTQISISEFCDIAITSSKIHDPVIFFSVIETCIIKAVYCSKAFKQNLAENYFKLAFKLIEVSQLSLQQLNKNEIINIVQARQNSLAKYHYAEHLIIFNKESESLDYIQEAKNTCIDQWLPSYLNEVNISLKMYDIMDHLNTAINHSTVEESYNSEFKTPAVIKTRTGIKTKILPRPTTPAVRKLKMTLESESPSSRENKIKFKVKETEKIKNNSSVKKKTGKENILKLTSKKEVEIKVREKRSVKKKETEQTSLVIKRRQNRLNL